jgi:hypothetical protein
MVELAAIDHLRTGFGHCVLLAKETGTGGEVLVGEGSSHVCGGDRGHGTRSKRRRGDAEPVLDAVGVHRPLLPRRPACSRPRTDDRRPAPCPPPRASRVRHSENQTYKQFEIKHCLYACFSECVLPAAGRWRRNSRGRGECLSDGRQPRRPQEFRASVSPRLRVESLFRDFRRLRRLRYTQFTAANLKNVCIMFA